ncbi:hypothetical protein GCM10010300_62080 [Streptomyces olivaceoviridis]|nr:hypothetical protein GCM10010300_62080 [Streptomyces olivaceoviridis]
MHGRRLQAVVQDRDTEVLHAQGGPTVVTGVQRDACREPSAGALPGHPDPLRIHTQLVRVLRQPDQCGIAVLQGGRERMLGREAVLHRHHHRTHLRRDAQSLVVETVDTAEGESTAVHIEQSGKFPALAFRRVDAHTDFRSAFRAGHGDITGLDLRRLIGGVERHQFRCRLSRLLQLGVVDPREKRKPWGEFGVVCVSHRNLLRF